MATFVHRADDGALVSWCPGDDDPVADDAHLSANGLAVVRGQPALDETHVWDAGKRTVVMVAAPATVRPLTTAKWILRFTPAEWKGVVASADDRVQHMLYALNHSTEVDLNDPDIVNGIRLLVALGLLDQTRAAAVLG